MPGHDPEIMLSGFTDPHGIAFDPATFGGDITIYDVLRWLVNQANWGSGAGGSIEESRRKLIVTRLIDRLEDQAVLGQTAINTTEDF